MNRFRPFEPVSAREVVRHFGRVLGVLVAALVLVACGPQGAVDALPEDTTFPHTVTGRLEVSVEEGPVLQRADLFGGTPYRVTLSGVDPISNAIGVTQYAVERMARAR